MEVKKFYRTQREAASVINKITIIFSNFVRAVPQIDEFLSKITPLNK